MGTLPRKVCKWSLTHTVLSNVLLWPDGHRALVHFMCCSPLHFAQCCLDDKGHDWLQNVVSITPQSLYLYSFCLASWYHLHLPLNNIFNALTALTVCPWFTNTFKFPSLEKIFKLLFLNFSPAGVVLWESGSRSLPSLFHFALIPQPFASWFQSLLL